MFSKSLKIQLFQLNFTVGDLQGNCQKIIESYQKAKKDKVDLVVFSELALTGYPPEDLLFKKHFLDEISIKIQEIKAATLGSKTAILFGTPSFKSSGLPRQDESFMAMTGSREINNSAIVIENGEIICVASKTCLPNYGVFDECRYFVPAPILTNFEFRGHRIVVLICEDIWKAKNAFLLGDKEFDLIISINASPFAFDKGQQRHKTVRKFIKNLEKPAIYLNQIGGQDSLVFDGGSFALDSKGEFVLKMKEFEEDVVICELNKSSLSTKSNSKIVANYAKEAQIYNALILGLREYVGKNGFEKIIIGMSGGIDSALVATIAVDALGAENVRLIALPSKFNSEESMNDALLAAKNLGVKLEVINIENIVEAMNKGLEGQFKDLQQETTEENIQSRIRGNILMALSNKFGHLLLTTGNKSELAVGYATIYGDMCGAFNPLKDVYKTEVFALAKWRNENIPTISIYKEIQLIPSNIIRKEPTAELRENQKDSDSLPEYKILDQILYQLIEKENSVKEIVDMGFEEDLTEKINRLFLNSEHKRKQSVLGVNVSNMPFDKARRYSITNHFKK
ncbi:MAG: NAD+ synthase [Rickettsiales bacterium]|jgi:NAD+ synthase